MSRIYEDGCKKCFYDVRKMNEIFSPSHEHSHGELETQITLGTNAISNDKEMTKVATTRQLGDNENIFTLQASKYPGRDVAVEVKLRILAFYLPFVNKRKPGKVFEVSQMKLRFCHGNISTCNDRSFEKAVLSTQKR
ncbi:CLUMA_CG012378, isoform A [Clunio marinus]|uniref:CLUMA_CG012378, isoform A n=1 Tax=Clunio marinus TaxID=568069 RepID=A0A1J1II88_9DIPT|nr:CLUMA_CG012378, isoform A [Clunio marinus]